MEDAVTSTKTWNELAEVIGEKNLELAPEGGSLVVRNSETEQR